MPSIIPLTAKPASIPVPILRRFAPKDFPKDFIADPALAVKDENLEVDFVTDTTVLSKSVHVCLPLRTAFAESISS